MTSLLDARRMWQAAIMVVRSASDASNDDPMRAVLDSASAAIVVCDAAGVVTYANRAFDALAGIDTIGHSLDALCAPATDARAARRVIAEDGAWSGELHFARVDGVVRGAWFSGVRCSIENAAAMLTERPRAQSDRRESSIPPFDLEGSPLRSIFEQPSLGVAYCSTEGRFMLANERFCELVGRSSQALLALGLDDITVGSPHPSEDEEARSGVTESWTLSVRAPSASEQLSHVVVHVSLVRDRRSALSMIVAIAEDRTAQHALAMSEENLRQIAETIDTVVWLASPDHAQVIYLSPSFEQVWGFPREELVARPARWLETVHPDDAARVAELFVRSPNEHAHQHRIVRPDGDVRWVDVHVRPVRDAEARVVRVVGTAQDVTESRRAEDQRREMSHQLEVSVQEKSILLREVHHRVKNNLQVISSLLYLEGSGAHDDAARRVLAVCRDRVLSMALVHEALYESGDLARVNIGTYLRRLVAGLRTSWGGGIDLTVECEVTAPPLDIETALPCGLIVNELVTNAFKYAFVGRPAGMVHVQLRRDTTEVQLVVADDGVGLPEDIDVDRPRTIGMRLVRALAGQLGGEVEVVRHAGTRIGITFPASDVS